MEYQEVNSVPQTSSVSPAYIEGAMSFSWNKPSLPGNTVCIKRYKSSTTCSVYVTPVSQSDCNYTSGLVYSIRMHPDQLQSYSILLKG